MPTDIYHSPYSITRKGNTDIHECVHEGTAYSKGDVRTVSETVNIEEHKEDVADE